MNLENKDLPNIAPKNSEQEQAAFAGESDGNAEPAGGGREFPIAGKPHGSFRPMFVMSGMALCMGLTSCVVPYDSDGGGGSVTVRSYSPGYRINSLPGGYRSETISGSTYYYHDGYYYRQGSGGYVVVDAPRGSRYHDDHGRRHQTQQPNRQHQQSSNRRDPRDERTEVITRLPSGYREVNHRGQRYYQSGDRYYRRQGDSYIIVSSPY